MARDWSKEPYRKLFLRPSKEWQALPVLVRGLGDELLRLADDDGRIFVGIDDAKMVATLCRLLGAHPDERKLIGRKLDVLLDGDNFIVREGAYLVIRNLAAAHRRGPGKGGVDGPRASHRSATGEPPLGHGQATGEPPLGHGQATGEPPLGHGQATGGTAPNHVSELTPRNYSGDQKPPSRTRARSQDLKEEKEGKEIGPASGPPPPPPPPTPKDQAAAKTIAEELRRRPELFGDEDLELAAARLQVTLEAEPAADRLDRRQLGRELLAEVEGFATKHPLSDGPQRVARLTQKLAWILGDLQAGRRKPPQQAARESGRNERW
jgi:hypothetical protein